MSWQMVVTVFTRVIGPREANLVRPKVLAAPRIAKDSLSIVCGGQLGIAHGPGWGYRLARGLRHMPAQSRC
jgi:hypothetical protein